MDLLEQLQSYERSALLISDFVAARNPLGVLESKTSIFPRGILGSIFFQVTRFLRRFGFAIIILPSPWSSDS
jgi:hypothetical protein